MLRCFLCLCICLTCLPDGAAQRNVLEQLIRKNKKDFGTWAQDPGRYDIQLIYTQIDRDARNRPSFTTYTYGANVDDYFYPASTVKMPAAFLALEKLNKLGIVDLDKHTPLKIGATRSPQSPVVVDTSAVGQLPTIGHYVRKVFLTSDNDAYNRLYEFLGQAYLNEQLRAKGLRHSRIIHRLSLPGFDSVGNQYTNPITFYDIDTLRYYQGPVYSRFYDDLGLAEQRKGRAYMTNDGEIVEEPFDFSYKNYVSLYDLHDMLRAVLFPEQVPVGERFGLTPEDYSFLYRAMGERPRESDYPRYDKPDNYVKFWLYGDREEATRIPESVRIFNKVGWAYGYLTDMAYIIDLETGVEFMLGGVIHVNANQTYNDGEYEYEEIGLPFFGELGRTIYDYEQKRQRKHRPDLSRFDVFR